MLVLTRGWGRGIVSYQTGRGKQRVQRIGAGGKVCRIVKTAGEERTLTRGCGKGWGAKKRRKQIPAFFSLS